MQAFSKIFFIYFICCCLFAIDHYICAMVDEKKLKTVANYADLKGKHRNWIYQLIKAGKVRHVNIDGIFFIKTDKE